MSGGGNDRSHTMPLRRYQAHPCLSHPRVHHGKKAPPRRPSRYRVGVVHESEGTICDARRVNALRPPLVFEGARHPCRGPGEGASAARLHRPSQGAGRPRAARNSPGPRHFRPASGAKLRPASAAFPLGVGHLRCPVGACAQKRRRGPQQRQPIRSVFRIGNGCSYA